VRVILTGYSGFIGSHVGAALRQELREVELLGVSRCGSPVPGEGFAVVRVNLVADPESLRATLRGFRPDAIVNCAGTLESGVTEAVRAHVMSAANLLRVLAEEMPGVRLIHIGSSAEYAQAVAPPESIAEDATPFPDGPYGVSKLAATQLVMTFGGDAGLRCTVLRLFNVIGRRLPESTLIGRVLAHARSAASSAPIELGPLGMHRDFVDARDVGAAVAAALRCPESAGHVVNIGSGEATCVRDLVRLVLDACGCEAPILEAGKGSQRSPHVIWQKADIRKAAAVLGWQPRLSLSETAHDLALGIGVDSGNRR